MKSIALLRNLFAPQLKIVEIEVKKEEQKQTPYLKAILSTTPSPVNAEKKLALTSTDLKAALRYIRESAMIRR